MVLILCNSNEQNHWKHSSVEERNLWKRTVTPGAIQASVVSLEEFLKDTGGSATCRGLQSKKQDEVEFVRNVALNLPFLLKKNPKKTVKKKNPVNSAIIYH